MSANAPGTYGPEHAVNSAPTEQARAYQLWAEHGRDADSIAAHLNADRPRDHHLTAEQALELVRAERRRLFDWER